MEVKMKERDFSVDDTTTTVNDDDGGATANVPAPQTIDPFALYVRNEGGGAFFSGDYLYFNGQTGEWSRGTDKEPIGATVTFLCNVHEIYIGWLKLVADAKPVREIGRIIDGYQRLPREALDVPRRRDWPVVRGEPQDPWKEVTYLPMRCMEDGEDVVFGPFSATGRRAVADFVNVYRRSNRAGKFPLVLLENRSFQNQSGGTTYVPDFKIVGWEFWDGQPAPDVQPVAAALPRPAQQKAIAARDDMDDSIPF
jgi:hypothetical protein